MHYWQHERAIVRNVRGKLRLARRLRTIVSNTGMLVTVGGLLMLLPLLALVGFPEQWRVAPGFALPALAMTAFGLLMWKSLAPRGDDEGLDLQEASAIIALSWILTCLGHAVPFMLVEGHGFTQALFEAVSGWSTTGLTVTDVTTCSELTLLWRSILQLAGGAGLAIIMIASLAGPTGSGLSAAEGRRDQLVPNIRASVKLVMALYGGYAVIGIVAFWVAGMNLFDSINHTFTSIATGGFSTYPDSIGHFNSVRIEAVAIALMILGNINFLTVYALVTGKLRAVLRNGELHLQAVLLPVCALVLFLFVCYPVYATAGRAARAAVFEPVSALSGTGATVTTYEHWGGLGLLILTALMVTGGGSGSTAGGLKQYRVYVLFKSVVWSIRRAFLPRAAVVEDHIWQGGIRFYVSDAHIAEIANYVYIYVAALVMGAAVIAGHGFEFGDALFEFASALGGVGLSVGITNYYAPPLVLWTEILGMFLGRLEFFVVIVGLVKLGRDIVTIVTFRPQWQNIGGHHHHAPVDEDGAGTGLPEATQAKRAPATDDYTVPGYSPAEPQTTRPGDDRPARTLPRTRRNCREGRGAVRPRPRLVRTRRASPSAAAMATRRGHRRYGAWPRRRQRRR